MSTSLSHTLSGRGRVTVKFNFRVGIEDIVGGLVIPHVGEEARLLFQLGSEPPLELS